MVDGDGKPVEFEAWYWIKECASSSWECAQAVDYGTPCPCWRMNMKDWIDEAQPFAIGPRILPPVGME